MSHNPRFFRYLPRNPSAAEWGATVLDAGHGRVFPGSEYPLPGHPDDHDFSWEKGRCLDAYTFVYITAGKGVFDSVFSGEVTVEAGSVFILFPGIWHRYRPEVDMGWDEYWVECEGEQLEAAVKRSGLSPSVPVIKVGHDDGLLRCFFNIVETIDKEVAGFEPVIAMRSLEIVARIRSLMRISTQGGVSKSEKIVRAAQLKMREGLHKSLDFHELASELGVSYSSFRRIFKKETGYPPGEYFIVMRMGRAKQLLLANKSIQEVADLLGFESIYYFSRLFKSRNGYPPSEFRPDFEGRLNSP